MDDTVVSISPRGQVTIPQNVRKEVPVKHFICVLEDSNVILKPLQTREDFLHELDVSENNWKKEGGLSLSAMKKK